MARGAALAVAMLIAGCVQRPGAPSPASAAIDSLPGWSEDRVADAMPALLSGCARLALAPVDQKLGMPGDPGLHVQAWQAGAWRDVCAAARIVPPHDEAAARTFFAQSFELVPLAGASGPDGLFTGYDEPELQGSREKTRSFSTAVLRAPADLLSEPGPDGHRRFGRAENGAFVAYASRAEIDAGALRRQRLDLAYLRSAIDLFFLQIQGAGRIELPNGHEVRVGYAANNGQPYVPIGRAMAERGDLQPDDISASAIRAWLTAHPREARATMELNPRYSFFTELPDLDPRLGPLGTLGVQLTPMRSVAVDASLVPLGAPVWIETTAPDCTKLHRLMLAQDNANAVDGPARMDIFFGWGAAAEQAAGAMRSPGRAWILLPRMGPQSR